MSYYDAGDAERIANAVMAVEQAQVEQYLTNEWERIKNQHPDVTDRDVDAFSAFLGTAEGDFDAAYDYFAYTRDNFRGNATAGPEPRQAQPQERQRTRHSGAPGAAFADATDDMMASLRANRR